MEQRIRSIRKRLGKSGLDALMVLVEENRRYLSGFTAEDVRFDESAGCLVITRDKCLLAVNPLYVTQAQQECPLWEIYLHKQGLAEALPDIVTSLDVKKLAFEATRLSVMDHAKIQSFLKEAGQDNELVPVRDWVEDLRLPKSPDEVQAIRASLELAEKAFLNILPGLKPGMTEKQAAWELEKAMRDLGAERMAFPVIVASGENAALPHAVPTDRPIGPNEPLLFDWGAVKDGYCSDISRTIILDGEGDQQFQDVFAAVSLAQKKAFEAIAPGVKARDVDAVAREVIDKAGFKGKFTHGLGHGVGMAVHEAPRLSPLSVAELSPGTVVTVEPGVYIPGWGGVRLENMALVTKNSAECLTSMGLVPG